jgi:hypothetical protein
MTPFRPRREHVGPDPHLNIKLILFAVGAAFGVAGMITGRDWLLYIGIAILVAGALLRFRRPAPEEEASTGGPDWPQDAPRSAPEDVTGEAPEDPAGEAPDDTRDDDRAPGGPASR